MNSTNYFLIRRLHSLLGVIPLGIFLFAHMATNAMAFFGVEEFDKKVFLIHSLGPLLPFVEAAVIFVPLALHIVIGIAIALTSKGNATDLTYGRNWAYTIQRWSGWLVLIFLVYHTMSLRFLGWANEVGYFAYLAEAFKNPAFLAFYALGGIATVYHFANGLCTFCMTWGLTVGPRSQTVMAVIATGVGIVLIGMLTASIIGFVVADVPAEMPTFPATDFYVK